jgi:hypothetical protein
VVSPSLVKSAQVCSLCHTTLHWEISSVYQSPTVRPG